MMKQTSAAWLGLKAFTELGATQVGLYGLYRLGIRTGHYERQLSAALSRLTALNQAPYLELHPCLSDLPVRDKLLNLLGDQVAQLYVEADEIVEGKVRLFGGEPVSLVLSLPECLENWTHYEGGGNQFGGQDIKIIWEPGRFGWACTLARAYHLGQDERYAEAFWEYTDQFLSANPPYMGPHWSSAQEVAIRLCSLAFAYQVFSRSDQTTPARSETLARALAIHAERIPPTMVYARSQNNNHLITEALGLYTASALLPEHPLAGKWHGLGWKWLQQAFRTQIAVDGTYMQHSTNYHRLMLQAALWAYTVHDHSFSHEPIPPEILDRLSSATNWLWKLLDPDTGGVPNLGHNDGSYILPLTICQYQDYRPVIFACADRFLHMQLNPIGPWNEMDIWLGSPTQVNQTGTSLHFWHSIADHQKLASQSPNILVNPVNNSWATLRVAQFHARPAHADQLHLDVWWHGFNLAQDPGTYLYNAPPPWDNSLTSALVHNTVTVDGKEFMQRAGRFLYLDWSQARIVSQANTTQDEFESLSADHLGYRKLGVAHVRRATAYRDGRWEIIDRLTGTPNRNHTLRLHWLLPNWEYEVHEAPQPIKFPWYEMRIRSPRGWITLNLGGTTTDGENNLAQKVKLQLARAGELVYGSGEASPISGWTSPTYGVKIPALACILTVSGALPVELKSEWVLPGES